MHAARPYLYFTGINRPGGEEITYQYDSRGNRVQASVCEIDTSNFVPSEYEYNTWDELSEIIINGSTYSFEYDPEGLRTVKETPEESIRYHCDDNGLVIAESDATDTVTAQNIWGHRALARKVNGTYYYYIYNGHGDAIQVIDEAGNTVNSYEYDEWGNILSQQETIDNPLKYCGEYYDDESGLYYLRARYYDPVLGRFVSQDEEEGDITNPLTLNRYAYCAGNPIIYIDPSGCYATTADHAHLSPTQCAEIDRLAREYDAAKAAGDKTAMDNAHQEANNIRSSPTSDGYSYNAASDSGDGQGNWASTKSTNSNTKSSNTSSAKKKVSISPETCETAYKIANNVSSVLTLAGIGITLSGARTVPGLIVTGAGVAVDLLATGIAAYQGEKG